MSPDSAFRPPLAMSKSQHRMSAILSLIPAAREQLLAAIEALGPELPLDAVIAAAQSSDPHERNKVGAIERQYEVLLNWLNELAARGLAEGQRLKTVEKGSGPPWRRLAELGVISSRTAERLQEAMEMRDELAHAYPPAEWRALREGTLMLLEEIDRYLYRLIPWLANQQILPPAPKKTAT